MHGVGGFSEVWNVFLNVFGLSVLGGGEGEGEGLREPHGEEGRGSITVGSCVSRDYTMTMRRWEHIYHSLQEENARFVFSV